MASHGFVRELLPPQGHRRRRSGLFVRNQPDFLHECASGGQAWLPSKLTINGTTVDAATDGFIYLASDINTGTGAWAEHNAQAAGALTLQAGSPTYDVDVLPGVGGGADEGATGDGTAYWQPAGTTFGNFDTDDFVVEVVALAFAPVKFMLAKRDPDGGANDHGYGFGIYAGNVPTFHFEDSSANGCTLSFPAVTVGALYHWLIVADRSGNAIGWQNAAAISAVDCSSVGSTDVAKALTIMAASGGNYIASGTIVSAAAWHAAGWLDTHLQADLAKERHARWMGLLANLSRYGDAWPTITRSTTSYYTRRHGSADKLHLAGAGMAALDDPGGVAGLPIYGAVTNDVPYPCTHSSGWSTSTGTLSDGGASLIAGKNWITFTEDSTASSQHFFADGTVIPTAGQKVLIQGYFTDVDCQYAGLAAQFSAVGSYGEVGICADLSAGTISDTNVVAGSIGTPTLHSYGIDDCGGGVYRLWMVVSNTHQCNANFFVIVHASDDGTIDADKSYKTYNGDGSSAFKATGIMNVRGADGPVPFVGDDDGAASTCNALLLDRDDWAAQMDAVGEGTIECEIKLPDIDLSSADAYVWLLSDGSADNRIGVFVDNADDKVTAYTVAGGVIQANSFDAGSAVTDDAWHTVSLAWRYGRVSLKVDGVEAVATGSLAVPAGLSEFSIGRYGVSNLYYLNGRFRNLKHWPYARH